MRAGADAGPVIVVGAGQAGLQLAASLRAADFDGPVTVVGDEPVMPYQRPPLSKAYLLGEADPRTLQLRADSYYPDHDIDLVLDDGAAVLDRARSRVLLRSGRELPFAHAVLASGARSRALPVPGGTLGGVLPLRSLSDAVVLRDALGTSHRVVVIGGGFVGTEVAAAGTRLGRDVTVVESRSRIMHRVVAPEISDYVTQVHRARGTRVLLNRTVSELSGANGRVSEVRLTSGEVLPADLVVVGIGVQPNSEIAAAAGLAVDDGVLVDDQLRTTDRRISAIGDCASFPCGFAGGRSLRLESVQNAVDQARHVAARLTGQPGPGYAAVPWFWTHQLDLKIQMAGIGMASDQRIVHGDNTSGRFSVFRFRNDRLVCVESVNRSSDHIWARKVLARGTDLPAPVDVADDGFDLKTFATTRVAAV